MFDPSPIHIILLLVIVLMIFGTKKLPEVGRSVGRGIREFRGSVTGRDTDASAQPSPERRASAPLSTCLVAADEELFGSSQNLEAAQQAAPVSTPETAVVREPEGAAPRG